MNQIRPDLPTAPLRIRALPVDARGYPVPWFVEWIGGVPDFRVMDSRKIRTAIKESRCWVCGQGLGSRIGKFLASRPLSAFVIGPMCAINRISSEPPNHIECAVYAAKACPFLTKPLVERRETNLPGGIVDAAGIMNRRNPGVALVWATRSYRVVREGRGVLFEMGDPVEVKVFARGLPATVEDLRESFETGYDILRSAAETEGSDAISDLNGMAVKARQILRLPDRDSLDQPFKESQPFAQGEMKMKGSCMNR